MQDALDIALEHAKRADATRILAVRMRVGALSGVEPSSLEFAFEVMKAGTPAKSARLEIDAVPGREFEVIEIEVE